MHQSEQAPSPLRFATFLSPNLQEVYASISRYIGEQTGHATELAIGQSLEDFADGKVHIGFVCGLPYSQVARRDDAPLELLAAPVLRPKRYRGKPIYFSDIIVRRDGPFTSFEDLQGCVWGYNERTSHSGWHLVCDRLVEQGKALDYFGELVKTGSHLRSLRMVKRGEVDAAAIDSHVLDVLRVQDPELDTKLRVIDTLGPSSMPPVVVSKSMGISLKREIQRILLHMHHDPRATKVLQQGLIARFVAVTDEHYQQIRDTFTRVQEL